MQIKTAEKIGSRVGLVAFWGLLVLVVAVVVAVVIAAKNHSVSSSFTITGTVEISDCYRANGAGYSDLRAGSQVAVVDQSSKVLAAGTLSAMPAPSAHATVEEIGRLGCTRSFTVANIPSGHSLYGIRVGSATRGVVWKTEAEARSGIALSIG